MKIIYFQQNFSIKLFYFLETKKNSISKKVKPLGLSTFCFQLGKQEWLWRSKRLWRSLSQARGSDYEGPCPQGKCSDYEGTNDYEGPHLSAGTLSMIQMVIDSQ